MKTFALSALCLSFIISSAHAQFYLRAGLGYAMPQAGQTMDANGTPYNGTYSSSTGKQTYTMKSASYSSGSSCTLGLGYMFSDHVGVQADAALGLANSKYTFAVANANISGYIGNEQVTTQAKSTIFLMPALVLQTGGSSSWNLYGRFGVVVPVKAVVTSIEDYYIPSQSFRIDYTSQLKSSFSLGTTAAAGLEYKLNDRTTLWGEVSMMSLSLFLKESKYTHVTVDGVSYPLDSIGGPHPVKYSKNVTVDTNYNTQPSYSLPFSNLGISIGVRVLLSEKKHKDHDLIDDKRAKPYKRRG